MPDAEPAVQPQVPAAAAPVTPDNTQRPEEQNASSWRHPGWAWTAGRDWIITSGFAVATLLIGAALGGIPVVVAGSWHDAQTRDQAWAFLGLGAAGLAVLICTEVVRRGRGRMLRRHGTAYIIQEEAREWSRDESRDFLASAQRQFARIIRVPGPGKLGAAWDWPLGDGAQRWDSKVAELALSFQALHSDDDPATPNGVFMWAWWPVAVAFGAQAATADRGLVLDIWQRPSRGRAGHLEPAPWSQRPHRFGSDGTPPSLGEILPESAPREFTWPAQVTATPRERHPRSGPVRPPRLSVLLLRLGNQSWGPIPEVPATPDPARPVKLALDDAAGLGTGQASLTDIHELRSIPPASETPFPWRAFPSLVAEVTAWIRRKAAELEGQTLLLGTVMPPEAALALGIEAAQVSQAGWPAHLWPIVYQKSKEALIVPRLDLGTTLLTSQIGST